jgi:class 3 adenylate cyclase
MKQPLPIIAQMVHIHGPMNGKVQEFDRTEIHIGRHPSCDLRFPKDLAVISRRHAVVVRQGNRYKIIDTSANGTFVNGSRISETWLKSGDVIIFTQNGPKVSFFIREGELARTPAAEVSAPVSHQHDGQVSRKQQAPLECLAVPSALSTVPAAASSQMETVRVPLEIQYGPLLKSFAELPVVIGTQADCDLVLNHVSLSHRHAQIFFSQGGYMVKDLTGSGQIKINNRQMSSPSPLNSGDRLFLTASGPAFQFMEGGRLAEITLEKNATIVFTDIVSSTRIIEQLGDNQARSIFQKHDQIIRDQLEKFGGYELQNLGDGFMLSFDTASSALRCATFIQLSMAEKLSTVSIRIGIHTGEVILREGNQPFGQAVVKSARIVNQCNGGQILLSDVTRQLCSGANFKLKARGKFVPKGFDEPLALYELVWKI